MTVSERVAYLKGLFEGLELDAEKKEGKLLCGMLEAMEELALCVSELKQQNEELMDELDDVYEELSAVTEDLLMDDDAVLDDDDLHFTFDSADELYQVICPTCGEVIYLDEEMLGAGSITCGACGEELEFDLSDLEDDAETE